MRSGRQCRQNGFAHPKDAAPVSQDGGSARWPTLFGFVDAFWECRNWYTRTYLAIYQGPIVILIERFRTGLLWNSFSSAPEVRKGLSRRSASTVHTC